MSVLWQVLGRYLEAVVSRAQEYKKEWKDSFVSIEHLVVGLVKDPRYVFEAVKWNFLHFILHLLCHKKYCQKNP